jgi:glutaredoxin
VKFRTRDISVDEEARKELVEKYGRLATPVLVAGEKMFLGFRQNREEIAKLIGRISGESNG